MALLMRRTGFALLILLSVFYLSACNTEEVVDVPVKEAWRQPLLVPVIYVVRPGDRLYSIAWMYGLDYQQIAQDNNISAPYAIRVGQQLRLRPQASTTINNKTIAITPAVTQQPVTAAPAAPVDKNTQPAATQQNNQSLVATDNTNAMTGPSNVAAPVDTPPAGSTLKVAGITWTWPAQGKIINTFASTTLNRGVDIAGKAGDPVVAAAAGKVVYAGNGLRGYGQLIIIKHNDDYLSAYAHNEKLLVKEGQTVRLGQSIATLGATETKSPMLHFEIRQTGKPVDPLAYLPTH